MALRGGLSDIRSRPGRSIHVLGNSFTKGETHSRRSNRICRSGDGKSSITYFSVSPWQRPVSLHFCRSKGSSRSFQNRRQWETNLACLSKLRIRRSALLTVSVLQETVRCGQYKKLTILPLWRGDGVSYGQTREKNKRSAYHFAF